ncbi:MAG: hypothetical protein HYU36_22520 [Planctomycetes bacterium]|nr:hypothetical protein [Planctomycetota bacterium]
MNAGLGEEAPAVRRHFNVLSPRTPLLLKGPRLYAAFHDGLWVFDVSDEKHPRRVAELKLSGFINDLAEVDNRTLALVNGAQLLTVDVSAPEGLRRVAEISVGTPEEYGPESLVVRGARAYVACRKAGLKVYDLADAAAPRFLNALPLRGMAKNLAFQGQTCFIATQTGVAVVDVSKEKPEMLSFYDSLRSAEEIVLRFPHVLIMSKEYFAAVDFSDRTCPRALGECTTLDLFYFRYPQDALMFKDWVITAQTEGGVYVLDWSDRARPRVVAQFSTWEPEGSDFRYVIATGLAFDGRNTLYVLAYDGRLHVLDLRRRRNKLKVYPVGRTELPKP